MKNSLFGYLPEMIKIRACDRRSYYAVSSEQTGFSVSVDSRHTGRTSHCKTSLSIQPTATVRD